MSKVTLQEHLLLCAQRAKTFTNENLLELNEAVIGALEEMASELEKKANSSDVNTALSRKADQAAMTTALNEKANSVNVSEALGLKANTADVKNALAFFNAAGLYVDTDGDIAQTD